MSSSAIDSDALAANALESLGLHSYQRYTSGLIPYTEQLNTRPFHCNDTESFRAMDGRQSSGNYSWGQADREFRFTHTILPRIRATQDYEARGMEAVWYQSVGLPTQSPIYTNTYFAEANQLLIICFECL